MELFCFEKKVVDSVSVSIEELCSMNPFIYKGCYPNTTVYYFFTILDFKCSD